MSFGKYELLERINIGGMAEVLKARDTSQAPAPIVAIKRILPHLTDDRQFVTMFLDESRVLAKLEHDNVIRTLEVGQVGETPFIALEYVWGQDARMLFHRARRSEEPIPSAITCYVITAVCAALHYAHELEDAYGNLLGIVHRDVSLQNILVSYEGQVKLTDFGIAMSAENVARTEVGVVKGKFGYMSPEQIKGEVMDRRSDVFATGICLYELLTGERLFSGESDYAAVEKVRNVVIEPPSRLNRQIPSVLEAIVMKALAKHPRDRFQGAGELRRALLGFMAESRNECSAKDLAKYVRTAFETDLRQFPSPDMLKREVKARRDEPTGLAAFDNLDPVSTVTGPSAVHPAPLVEAEGRRPQDEGASQALSDEIAGEADQSSAVFAVPEIAEPLPGAFAGKPQVARGGLDRQDGSIAQRGSPALQEAAIGAEFDDGIGDDEVTRQIYVGETYAGVNLGVSELLGRPPAPGMPSPFATLPSAALAQSVAPPASFEAEARTYRAPTAQMSYGMVVGIVVGIIALISGALYLTRGSQAASVHLTTAPRDARVRIDGKLLVSSESPFILDDLAPERTHYLEIEKEGYRSWSTTLSLASGQLLRLPQVTLTPLPAEQPLASPEPSAATSSFAAPTAARPERAAPAKRRTAAQAPRGGSSKGTASKVASAPSRAKSHSPARAQPLSPGGTGVLRLNSRPWSQVTIDGRLVGNTPQMHLPLAAGAHTITLVNPQFQLKKTIKVRIQAGRTMTRVVDLQ